MTRGDQSRSRGHVFTLYDIISICAQQAIMARSMLDRQVQIQIVRGWEQEGVDVSGWTRLFVIGQCAPPSKPHCCGARDARQLARHYSTMTTGMIYQHSAKLFRAPHSTVRTSLIQSFSRNRTQTSSIWKNKAYTQSRTMATMRAVGMSMCLQLLLRHS